MTTWEDLGYENPDEHGDENACRSGAEEGKLYDRATLNGGVGSSSSHGITDNVSLKHVYICELLGGATIATSINLHSWRSCTYPVNSHINRVTPSLSQRMQTLTDTFEIFKSAVHLTSRD